MRRGFGLIGALVTLIVLVVVGAIAYNIGWSDGVGTHLPAGTAAAPGPYYGYGMHGWFAGFGILWFLFILFGIFWLFRLAFWGFGARRMWSYGRGWGGSGGPRGFGPQSFEERAQEWHRRQHESPSSGTTPPPPPPSDTRSV